MNKEQKRALYESIMMDVARIVKRHINEYSQEEMMEDRRKQAKVKAYAVEVLKKYGYTPWSSDNDVYFRVSVDDYSEEKKIRSILTSALRPASDRFGSKLQVNVEMLPSGFLAAEITLPAYDQCVIPSF